MIFVSFSACCFSPFYRANNPRLVQISSIASVIFLLTPFSGISRYIRIKSIMSSTTITQSYYTSITAPVTPARAFECLTVNIPDWWTSDFKGLADETGGQFTVCFGTTFMTMQIIELVFNKRISWRCIDSRTDTGELNDEKELTGTKIVWEIVPSTNTTSINMTHEGLIPKLECYSIWEQKWMFFIHQSLLPLLQTGQGHPFKKNQYAVHHK